MPTPKVHGRMVPSSLTSGSEATTPSDPALVDVGDAPTAFVVVTGAGVLGSSGGSAINGLITSSAVVVR